MTWVSQLTEPSLAETQLVGMTLVSGPMLLPRWSMKVSTWARAGSSPGASDRTAAAGSHQAPGPFCRGLRPDRPAWKGNMPANISKSCDRSHFGASIAAVVLLSDFLKKEIKLAQGIDLQGFASKIGQWVLALIFLKPKRFDRAELFGQTGESLARLDPQ